MLPNVQGWGQNCSLLKIRPCPGSPGVLSLNEACPLLAPDASLQPSTTALCRLCLLLLMFTSLSCSQDWKLHQEKRPSLCPTLCLVTVDGWPIAWRPQMPNPQHHQLAAGVPPPAPLVTSFFPHPSMVGLHLAHSSLSQHIHFCCTCSPRLSI